ncbi:tRNA pseudouridine(13) synthase TruD [Haloarculaceae archaeon H-GB2-1]|nr:tRNA pseudouridine(13) synthase TruD [Haloarculaceae archaeon H-GB1-1]MEA5407997.1 tRNA pseudouridine(13) synthase TruD [Haloarculaceae archaeon H-GB2-1]
MRPGHPLERAVGIEHYVSSADGIGGEIKRDPDDFRVRELERFDAEPLDADTGAYPHLLLRATLRGWDTNDFASTLSNGLGISRERVSWAGTKDKRAVTTQLVSVKDADPEAIPDVHDAEIEVVGRTGRPILFGDLAGNAFEIVVRDPDHPEYVDDVVADLRSFGDGAVAVPNYFGQQRFGSRRPVTHEVGLAVARGDWKDAVMTYVGNPSEREPEDTQEARAFVDDTEDWQAALDRMPGRLRYERSMLHTLVENGGDDQEDFRAALETVPTNLQSLFVNAAQSYAFNRILSKRLERGLPFTHPVEGDVVCFADADAPDGLSMPDTDRTQQVTAARVDTVARHCERGRAFVTAPLVGTETELSDGEPGEIERAVLEDLDLAPSDFDLPGAFDSTGTRRAVLVDTALDVERDPLTFSFSLPKGSYATVVLREFLKTDPGSMS